MYVVLKKVPPLFQNPAKNIFMNQFTKTHVPGFQIKQRAGNEWESRESWPRPPWLCGCNPASLPRVDFEVQFLAGEGPSRSPRPPGGQKHIKGWRERAPCTGLLGTPISVQDQLSSVCVDRVRCSLSSLCPLLPPASSNLHRLGERQADGKGAVP